MMRFDSETLLLAVIALLIVGLFLVGFSSEKEGYNNGLDYVANEWCIAEGHEQGMYDQELEQVVCKNVLAIER